jgi:hypothetical protein
MQSEDVSALQNSVEKDKDRLLQKLQTAFEIELSTIPPYWVSLLSIKPDSNPDARQIIRGVMMEEMLHLAIVANLVNCISRKVQIGSNNLPSYPLTLDFQGKTFTDRQFEVNLAPFSRASIEIFTQIELPQDWSKPEISLFAEVIKVPAFTIGEFYKGIISDLVSLCDKYGPKATFTGEKSQQIDEEFYWGGRGKLIVIKDLESAKKGLDLVIQQGEGTRVADSQRGSNFDFSAHFYRFREILFSRRYKVDDDPREEPTGDLLSVNFVEVFPIKANARQSDYDPESELARLNLQFNRHYTVMLLQLVEAFNESPKSMYTAIMNGMHGLKPIAERIIALPIPGNEERLHGCPSFEWSNPLP